MARGRREREIQEHPATDREVRPAGTAVNPLLQGAGTLSWVADILSTGGPVNPVTAGVIVTAAEHAYHHSGRRGRAWAQYEARQAAKGVLVADAAQLDPEVVTAYQIYVEAQENADRAAAAYAGPDGNRDPWAPGAFASASVDYDAQRKHGLFCAAWSVAIERHTVRIEQAWHQSDQAFIAAHREELRAGDSDGFDGITAAHGAAPDQETAADELGTARPSRAVGSGRDDQLSPVSREGRASRDGRRQGGGYITRPRSSWLRDREPGWVSVGGRGQSHARYVPGKGILHAERRSRRYAWWLEGGAWPDGIPWAARPGEGGFPAARDAMRAADAHARSMPSGIFDCLTLSELGELGRRLREGWARLADAYLVVDWPQMSLAFEISGLRQQVTDQEHIRLMPRPWQQWSSRHRKNALGTRHDNMRSPARARFRSISAEAAAPRPSAGHTWPHRRHAASQSGTASPSYRKPERGLRRVPPAGQAIRAAGPLPGGNGSRTP
jgi:hypothetical protein